MYLVRPLSKLKAAFRSSWSGYMYQWERIGDEVNDKSYVCLLPLSLIRPSIRRDKTTNKQLVLCSYRLHLSSIFAVGTVIA